jgi:hypothetical protein
LEAKMEELNLVEINEVSGGFNKERFGLGCALIGLGLVGVVVAPLAVGTAAVVGLGVAGGVSVAGGSWLIQLP